MAKSPAGRPTKNTVRRILHPSDFSPPSRRALDWAARLARDHAAEVLILHVIPPRGPAVGRAYLARSAYEEIARAEAERGLAAARAQGARAGAQARVLLEQGLPHREILRVARRERVDLVVMGTSGRTGLSGLLLGSVASRVAAQASCPVLTVR